MASTLLSVSTSAKPYRWPLRRGRRHHGGSAMEPRLDAGAPDEGMVFTPS